MGNFTSKQSQRVSRQQAAERLADLAYALTTGPPLVLTLDGRRITVPLPDELFLKAELRSVNGGVELELALAWSTATTSSRPEAVPELQARHRPATEQPERDAVGDQPAV